MTDRSKTSYNEKEKIWYGIKEERTFDPESSLGELIFKSLQKKPEAIAQVLMFHLKTIWPTLYISFLTDFPYYRQTFILWRNVIIIPTYSSTFRSFKFRTR